MTPREPGCWQTRSNTLDSISYDRSVGNGALVVPVISERPVRLDVHGDGAVLVHAGCFSEHSYDRHRQRGVRQDLAIAESRLSTGTRSSSHTRDSGVHP